MTLRDLQQAVDEAVDIVRASKRDPDDVDVEAHAFAQGVTGAVSVGLYSALGTSAVPTLVIKVGQP